MPLKELRISGYRSIRKLSLPLKNVTVITGPNGSGKSNLYQSLVLLARIAQGELGRAVAAEGGMPSVLWAGKRQKGRVRLSLGVTLDEWSYDFTCGLPAFSDTVSFFSRDPAVKEEQVSLKLRGRKTPVLKREGSMVSLRDQNGNMVTASGLLQHNEAALAEIRDPHQFPELHVLREKMRHWRFYHRFRTDEDSPLRRPRYATQTPILSRDGSDLAAALVTIGEMGQADALAEAVDRAFPGSRLKILGDSTNLSLGLEMPGILRPLNASELSDGTLCYLCLLAALLSPRPAPLIALNEPETSLHPDLIAPLAELIAQASEKSQVWVTTHSKELAGAVAESSGQTPLVLNLEEGETRIVGNTMAHF